MNMIDDITSGSLAGQLWSHRTYDSRPRKEEVAIPTDMWKRKVLPVKV